MFGLITCAEQLLKLYVGVEYIHLTIWLQIWLLTVYVAMHNAPVSSLVLASGKTRFLVISSGVACLATIPITIFFAGSLNVGAAVLGYLAYVILAISAYYFYYTPVILKLAAAKLFFKAFLPSFLLGALSFFGVSILCNYISIYSSLYLIVIQVLSFAAVYITLLVAFIVPISEVKTLLEKFRKKTS